DQIKAYTIAVEALGRGEDFDPYIDPIVRVDAGRLRRALERYYAGVGATDTILIHIPRGHYFPEFRYRQSAMVIRLRSLTALFHDWRRWLPNISVRQSARATSSMRNSEEK